MAEPELLSSISYEELKTLALAYPYAHNLRYLLALKAKLEDRPDAARTLATAAAYSLDRTRLFLLYAPKILAPQRLQEELGTEILELKPIDIVQKELGALTPVKRPETIEAPPAQQSVLPIPEVSPATALGLSGKQPVAPVWPSAQKQIKQNFNTWYAQFNLPVLEKPPAALVLQPAPSIVPSRTSVQPTPEIPVTAAPPEKREVRDPVPTELELQTSKQNELSAQALAERSVTENKAVVSETLARLLAKQGHRDKAIAMYERLYLVYPEKSAYFAAEIDKLKK